VQANRVEVHAAGDEPALGLQAAESAAARGQRNPPAILATR